MAKVKKTLSKGELSMQVLHNIPGYNYSPFQRVYPRTLGKKVEGKPRTRVKIPRAMEFRTHGFFTEMGTVCIRIFFWKEFQERALPAGVKKRNFS